MHREHHAYPDTPQDPHSPKYSKNLFDMMWKTRNHYSAISNHQMPVDERFTKGVPRWDAFDNIARSWPSRLFWGRSTSIFT